MQASEFINVYGNVGYFLRNNNLNTPGRVSMLASLVYLQSKEKINPSFDQIYSNSLKFTEEKLEITSFRSFISKLEEEIDQGSLIDEKEMDKETKFQCLPKLLELLEEADSAFTDALTQD